MKDKYKEKFEQLNQFVEPNRNFKNLRQAISLCLKTGSTAIPFIGVILSDFTFFDDGNPDFVEEKVINFLKYRMVKIFQIMFLFHFHFFKFHFVIY